MIRLIKKSLFAKIILIICLTVLLINIIVAVYFTLYIENGHLSQIMRPVDLFLDYMIRDIGYPPDPKKIDTLSKITGFDIYIEGYNSEKSGIDPASLMRNKWGSYWYGSTFISLNDGNHVAIKESSGRKVYFVAPEDRFSRFDSSILKIIIILSLVLLLSYLLIKQSLKPVKQLTIGMNEIARGNLDYIIPYQGGDELGRLSDTFNEMNRKLLEMVKLKEQLLYDVSHELRSPLTRVNVALEMIEQNEFTRSMKDDLQNMDKMIRELLENGRFSGSNLIINKKEFRLKDLLQEIITKLNASPQIIIGFEDLKITGEREKVRIVFKNIIENAVKYSSPDKPIVISGSRDKTGVTISICDKGIGIQQEDLDRIFEPFYRTDLSRSRETGGFGLGLSIAKKIIAAHGGRIWAESGGEETCINIYFPESETG